MWPDPACASASPYSAPGINDAGEYDITGPMTLSVPSFQPTGTYRAVMTVFLV